MRIHTAQKLVATFPILLQYCWNDLNCTDKVVNFHLKNIASTSSSRGPRCWSHLIVRVCRWPTIDNLSEGFSEVIAQEGVQEGINTAVGVG